MRKENWIGQGTGKWTLRTVLEGTVEQEKKKKVKTLSKKEG